MGFVLDASRSEGNRRLRKQLEGLFDSVAYFGGLIAQRVMNLEHRGTAASKCLTVSIGVATADLACDAVGPETLLRSAEEALRAIGAAIRAAYPRSRHG